VKKGGSRPGLAWAFSLAVYAGGGSAHTQGAINSINVSVTLVFVNVDVSFRIPDADSGNVPVIKHAVNPERSSIHIIIITGKPVILILVTPLTESIKPYTVCGLFLLLRGVQLTDAGIRAVIGEEAGLVP